MGIEKSINVEMEKLVEFLRFCFKIFNLYYRSILVHPYIISMSQGMAMFIGKKIQFSIIYLFF